MNQNSWLRTLVEDELMMEVSEEFLKKVEQSSLCKLLAEPFVYASAHLIIRMSIKDVFYQEYGRKVEDVLNDS